jgi:predicted PurR-regulated permease PerM
VLWPFYVSVAFAFVLDPLCDLLERLRLPRTLAVLLVMAGFALLLSGVFILLLPIAFQQAIELIDRLPRYVEVATARLQTWAARIEQQTGMDLVEEIRSALGEDERLLGWAGESIRGLLSSGLVLSQRIIEIGIIIVVVFFLLRDFDRIVARIKDWLPVEYAATIRGLSQEAYDTLRGFIRGQGLVCLILGTFYAAGLTAIGLPFGILVGLAIGLISFIPYVGATIGLITSLSLAVLEFDSWLRIGGVAAIFFVGQLVEGNVLIPVLVGDRVRLHPVWVIVGLYVGGAMFGFIGVLLAVPITAVLGVFARFALDQYLESPLHRLDGPQTAGAGDDRRGEAAAGGADRAR